MPFPSTPFFVTPYFHFLNLNSFFPFHSPLFAGQNPAILFHECNQLHKNLSWFPSPQLAFISSSLEPHCALLYPLVALNPFILLWLSHHLDEIVNFLRASTICWKVLIKYLLNWVLDFSLSAGYSVNILHKAFSELYSFFSQTFSLLTSFFCSDFAPLQVCHALRKSWSLQKCMNWNIPVTS